MSFNLPAAALAGAIEEAGTAAEVAANKGDAPVNVFNELGEQGAVLLLRCDAAAACAFGWNWSRVRRLSGLKWTARPPIPALPAVSLTLRPPPPHTHTRCTALHCTALQTASPAWPTSRPTCTAPAPCCAAWRRRSPSCSCTPVSE